MKKQYDIVIAGGGAIGAACAYFLSREKDLKIALVDYKKPGNASRASAGGLWAIGESVGLGCGVIFFKQMTQQRAEAEGVDLPPMRPHILPECFFEFALKSNDMYPALWQELKDKHGVDFKFEKTGLKYIMYDKFDKLYADSIVEQIPGLAEQINWLSAEELAVDEPHINADAIGALEFACDHQVNPYRLNEAYLEAARQNGVELFLQTHVTGVEKQGNKVTAVVTDSGTLHCDTMINAMGAWAAELSEMATGTRIPVTPVKGQIILSERLPKILKGCVSTTDCYIAQKDNGEVLIGSTTEEKGFDTTNTLPEIKELANGAMRCIPELKDMNIKRCWAGLRPGTPDELPILGKMAGTEGYINACGHFRTGILTSAITGKLINDLYRGQPLDIDLTPFEYARFLEQENEQEQVQEAEQALV
ncbi:FAD-dependent oxidoreductase [Thalassomonas viridans]|uniref:FAD-dependent oxidoreductase n=1 Tax=Thalassomonas viridans TaxID=137584 RepID=A0AAE9Z7D0_9GAMM|nr:FAD-dependent oxidoreductase [Thalassomonas viridans]WDE07339.1 FAD-dependent oxidoreductase [Thalassomonas viridans]